MNTPMEDVVERFQVIQTRTRDIDEQVAVLNQFQDFVLEQLRQATVQILLSPSFYQLQLSHYWSAWADYTLAFYNELIDELKTLGAEIREIIDHVRAQKTEVGAN